MNRYYLPSADWQDETLALGGEEAKHCARVMRAKVGDKVEIFNGEGRAAVCEITAISNSCVQTQILEQTLNPPVTQTITLCQAIPKSGNMELIVQKAVELGVSVIQPLITEHTVARPDPQQLEKKRSKWQRIALEACKQCGQNHLPEVSPPRQFQDFIADENTDHKIIAALHPDAVPMKSATDHLSDQKSVHLLIGPEGDFSPAEYRLAIDAGYIPVTLGDIILRTETATLYCLSVLKHEITAQK